jgi:hypothetical protein
MKNLILPTLFIFTTFILHAQEKVIKTFLGVEKRHKTYFATDVSELKNQLGDPLHFTHKVNSDYTRSFALTKMSEKNNRFRESIISNFAIENHDNLNINTSNKTGLSQPVSGGNYWYASIAYSFTQNFRLSDEKDKRLFWIGGGFQSYNQFDEYTPSTSLELPFYKIQSKLKLLLVPRMTYRFNQNFLFDIHIPLIMNCLDFEYLKMKNPQALTSFIKNSTLKDMYIPSNNEIRFGFGYCFGKNTQEGKSKKKK